MNWDIVGFIVIVAVACSTGVWYGSVIMEQHRETVAVCNSDHVAENMTQYCLEHQALNTTLWGLHHK